MEDSSIQIETGAQLLARLMKRPSLTGLEKVLFREDGPREKEVIEICGDSSSGKTLLTTQLLVKCLLPKSYKSLDINGLGAGVLLINTDHHFQISMLFNLMNYFIINSLRKKKSSLHNDTVKKIIEDSLKHLTIVNCYDSAQFYLALQSLHTIISNDDKISLVAVDSISSYYWQDRLNGGIWSMDGYLKNCLRLLQKNTLDHKIVLLYTRPSEFESKGKEVEDCASRPEEERLNYKIRLQKCDKKLIFNAVVESAVNKRNLSYSINDYGVEWIMKKK